MYFQVYNVQESAPRFVGIADIESEVKHTNKSLRFRSPLDIFALHDDNLGILLRHLKVLLLRGMLGLRPQVFEIDKKFIFGNEAFYFVIHIEHDSLDMLGSEDNIIAHIPVPLVQEDGEFIEI